MKHLAEFILSFYHINFNYCLILEKKNLLQACYNLNTNLVASNIFRLLLQHQFLVT